MIEEEFLKPIDKDILLDLCLQYDIEVGKSPGMPYAGRAMYNFVVKMSIGKEEEIDYDGWVARIAIKRRIWDTDRDLISKS